MKVRKLEGVKVGKEAFLESSVLFRTFALSEVLLLRLLHCSSGGSHNFARIFNTAPSDQGEPTSDRILNRITPMNANFDPSIQNGNSLLERSTEFPEFGHRAH